MNKRLIWMILGAFIAGLAVGIVLWWHLEPDVVRAYYVPYVSPFGDVLVSMLKMIVIPVILLSLISGAASLPTKEFGKIGIKVLAWYFITSLFAAVVGSALAVWFNPGSGASKDAWQQMQSGVQAVSDSGAGSLVAVFLGMFQNPFQSLAQGNFLAIIVFAIGFGIAIKIV